jgi:uncharacterized protein YvpB
MSGKLVSLIRISSFLVILAVSITSSQSILSVESFDTEAEVSDSAAYISVPLHYQSNNYYCGPAALEMVFDYYGEDISQTEIADVARTHPYETYTTELRRAAHFSNLSTSLGDEMSGSITGYSARKIGYAAFEKWGLTVDDLKALIDKGEPLIVLMWWTPSKVYGHYRVVVGYNETHIVMHDPWNKNLWGGTYGGANTSMTYSTFLDLWECIGNWGLWVRPWDVELQIPGTVSEGDDFEVIANITYSCSIPFGIADYPASSCKATIELQEGLELASGETAQHYLGNVNGGNSVQTVWAIHPSDTGFYNISVVVTGIVEGSVEAYETYPSYSYEDKIGGLSVGSLFIIMPPAISILSPRNKTYTAKDVPLTFSASESASWIGYSLDGQENQTITGNTTLLELSDGLHSLIVYAEDAAGNVGASEIVQFTVEALEPEPFPIWTVAVIVIVVGAAATVLVYTKIKKTTGKVK